MGTPINPFCGRHCIAYLEAEASYKLLNHSMFFEDFELAFFYLLLLLLPRRKNGSLILKLILSLKLYCSV
jgi:hypothetical protein